ncbi:MAG: DUF1080 domain-containing protein [Planctomycetia bacterium]|jgi:hypothetical protein
MHGAIVHFPKPSPRRACLRGILIGAAILAMNQPLGPAAEPQARPLFDGTSLDGWQVRPGEERWWRVADGAILGGSPTEQVPHNTFVCSRESFQNFELRLKIRIRGQEGFVNSGIQIRSVRVPGNHEMIGYQVDAGDGWWGKLYDESRRKKVIAEPVDGRAVAGVRRNDWNDYRIRAEGPRIRTWINDTPALDYTEQDRQIPRDGRIGLQVHGGGTLTVEFKDISIIPLETDEGAPVWGAALEEPPQRAR